MDGKAEAVDDLTNFLAWLLKIPEKIAFVRLKNAIEPQEVHDEIGRQVPRIRRTGLAFHGIDGPRERPDLVFRHCVRCWHAPPARRLGRYRTPITSSRREAARRLPEFPNLYDVENHLIRLNPASSAST